MSSFPFAADSQILSQPFFKSMITHTYQLRTAKYHRSLKGILLVVFCISVTSSTVIAQDTSQEQAKKESLPPVVSLSGARDPLKDLEKPLITAQEVSEFRPKQSDYVQALRAGETTGRSREIITEGIEVRLYVMTLPEQIENINTLRQTFQRELVNYAGANQINPRQKRKFREMVLTETLRVLKELLENQLDVRMTAATMAGQLNIVEEDRRTQTPAEPFKPSLQFLNDILRDQNQHQAVKILAVHGIMRILGRDDILKFPRNEKLQTAELLEKELQKEKTFFWYQQKLIQGLRSTQMDVDRSGAPFVVQILAKVIGDPNRDPRVRAEAAYAISRVPIPANVNLGMLAWQVAKAAEGLAMEYNKAPEQAHWINSFLKIYGAFQPLKRGKEEGLIFMTTQAAYSAHQAKVKEAYDLTVIIVKAIWDNNGGVKLAPNKLVPLSDWLKANDPGQTALYPGGPTASQLNAKDQTAATGGP